MVVKVLSLPLLQLQDIWEIDQFYTENSQNCRKKGKNEVTWFNWMCMVKSIKVTKIMKCRSSVTEAYTTLKHLHAVDFVKPGIL